MVHTLIEELFSNSTCTFDLKIVEPWKLSYILLDR